MSLLLVSRKKWRARLRLAVAPLVLLGGILASLALFQNAREVDRQAIQADLATRARGHTQLLETGLLRSMGVLHAMAALFQTRDEVTRGEFRGFVADALQRQPELQALGWTPRVVAGDRLAYEAAARRDGLIDFEFREMSRGQPVRAGDQPEYFPVYYIEPQSLNRVALGYELDSDKSRAEALQRARATRIAAATPPLRLVQEEDDRLGFVVYLPVYQAHSARSVGAQRAGEGGELIGFASAVFHVDDLIRPSLAELLPQGLDAWMADASAEGRALYHAGGDARGALSMPPPKAADLHGEATLDIAGRKWDLTIRPTAAYIAARASDRPRVVLLTGLLASVLLAGYLHAGSQRTSHIERRVAERTTRLSMEVAERRRAESAARHAEVSARLAEARYRDIFENSVEGMFQTTPGGHYLRANAALARVYGYESIDQLMSDLTNIARQLYVDPGRRDEFVGKVRRDGVVWEFESKVFRLDGSIVWISENARAVRDEAENVLYFEGTVIDVTARKEAEALLHRSRDELEAAVGQRTEELAQTNERLQAEIVIRARAEADAAAANQAKSTFLACMSHEIRTPMNAILGYAQLLSRDPTLPPSHRNAVRTIQRSGDHLLGLIDDVLDLSKIEAGRLDIRQGSFNFCEMLADLDGMFRERCEQKGLSLRIEMIGYDGASPIVDLSTYPLASDVPAAVRVEAENRSAAIVNYGSNRACTVVGDERKLRQVLINLLGNALKFTDTGGVSLRARAVDEDQYLFEVTDTGTGIPAEAATAIFEPFRQAPGSDHRGGTGLGLAIARQHVELMGGELAFASTPGVGSTFYFRLSLPTTNEARDAEVFHGRAVAAIAPVGDAMSGVPAPAFAGLPDDLCFRMRAAAGVYGTTELKQCLHDVDKLGPAARPAAEFLRQCIQRYDMDGILRSLHLDGSPSRSAASEPRLT